MIHYNTRLRDIDRSLERMEAERVVDYRPLFLSNGQNPAHDDVRSWVAANAGSGLQIRRSKLQTVFPSAA
jgi:hypothetical protein